MCFLWGNIIERRDVILWRLENGWKMFYFDEEAPMHNVETPIFF